MPGTRAITSGYRPLAGAFDELVGADGRVRDHWRGLLEAFDAPAEVVDARFAAADRHLKNSGVSYRVYDEAGGGERPWQLSHVPLLIEGEEWRRIEAGIVQRARLLSMVLDDLYGPGDLVASGALPAAVVAGNPQFLRPLAGVSPRGGHLSVYAADLARGPDGVWRVLGDRAQAPSGMGYALENRLALSGALSPLYRDSHVERLAPFFQTMRSALAAKAGREGARIGLLTPGPANETYFEHAYLARYLGFLLVEGGDLKVQDGALHVRTIEGLKRIEVLLRRLDAEFCDPVELNADSQIGVPGLVEAVREGSVALANALGAGLIEARAMLAFLPALAPRLLGEDLVLPNVATWWCGDAPARREALESLPRLRLAAAFARRPPGFSGDESMLAAPEGGFDAMRLADLAERYPLDIVAQEPVRLSTMPVWRDGVLVPRPFSLRVFAVRGENGWAVMPGGFCRVAETADPSAMSMQRGGRSADVWVLAEAPVEPVTLLPVPGRVRIRRRLGHLPSRAADNLFWLGRYVERAEATLRLVRALAEISIETDADDAEAARRLAWLLVAWDAAAPGDAEAVALAALSGATSGSARTIAGQVLRTAAVIRERLIPDALRALEDFAALTIGRGPGPRETADRALRVLAAFSGLAQENMDRIAGWRLLEAGRRIERAILTCRIARILGDETAREAALDALLKVTDSRIPYRARYLTGTLREPVLDLVLLDEGNPRSLAFQVARLAEHLSILPGLAADGVVDPVSRRARLLRARVETSEARDLDVGAMLGIETDLLDLAADIVARLHAGIASGDVVGDLG